MPLTQCSKKCASLILIFAAGLLCGCSKQAPVQSQAAPIGRQQQRLNAAAVQEAVYEQNPETAMKALAVNPDDINAHKALVYVYMGKSQYPAAVTQLREVLRLRPDDHAKANLLALCLDKAGDRRGALAEWRQIAKRNDQWGQVARRNILKRTRGAMK